MREQDAIYGGEMSAHHYFRDFAYCDSGVIPWPLIWEHISVSNLSLSELNFWVSKRFTSSGELNFTVSNAETCIERVQNYFVSKASSRRTGWPSMSFNTWRFNLRKSNTEPLVRLNIETRGNEALPKKDKSTDAFD